MQHRIHTLLAPVRRRQRVLRIVRSGTNALVSSYAVVLVWISAAWLLGVPASPAVLLALLVAGPLCGAFLGAYSGGGWPAAAIAVDRHYDLKDRATTALSFLPHVHDDPLYTLQLLDAATHLDGVVAREVVPWRLPRTFPLAMVMLLAAAVLLLLPAARGRPHNKAPADPLPAVVAEADLLLQRFDTLAAEISATEDDSTDDLLGGLRDTAMAMKQPGIEPREALAKLSDVQTAMADRRAEYNVGLVDAQLGELGEALALASLFAPAGAALQTGRFDQAADALERLDPSELSPVEAEAIEQNLDRVAQSMRDARLEELADATTELGKVAGQNDAEGIERAAGELARLAREHAQHKEIDELLRSEIAGLTEAKMRMQQAGSAGPEATNNVATSKTPGEEWGTGEHGQQGETTEFDAPRNRQQLTGLPGEGPSEVETLRVPHGEQAASRPYRETYQEYRKLSEAVLQSEPLPLGHRQTIRRYFELIRPDEEDMPASGP